jgi:hypothetical protein
MEKFSVLLNIIVEGERKMWLKEKGCYIGMLLVRVQLFHCGCTMAAK